MSRALLFGGLALAVPLILVRQANATQPATDIGVVPVQGTPSQPPPNLPPPNAPPPPAQGQSQFIPAPVARAPAPPPDAERPKLWEEGDPVPAGFHVEERARKGLVVGGLVLTLVPYAISSLVAIGAKGDNQTNWLFMPVAGPWFLLGMRHYSGCSRTDDGLGCAADVLVVTGLVLDGVLQVAGASLTLLGFLNTKSELVRDERALRVRPMRIGATGYGLGAFATF